MKQKQKGFLIVLLYLTHTPVNQSTDVKEILKPAGDIKRQSLLNELIDFRKLLLIYRLIHFQDPITDIDIGLEGRHKELCKPVLQLFHNSIHSLKEIEGSFQTLLNAKNQRKGNSIEATLHPIIVNLVSVKGNDIYVGQIWDGILETIPGIRDEKRPNEFQTYDYGTIYRNTITNIICDKFGAERRRRKEGSILSFDPEKLASMGRLYNLETKIQTKITDGVSSVGDVGSKEETRTCQPSKEGVDNYDVTREGSSCETLLRQSSKESVDDVSDVSDVGSKEETRTCQPSKDSAGDVSDVGFRGDTSGQSADYRNEKSEASGIGAQKIHDNNTNRNNLDFFWSNNHPQSTLEPTQPTSPTPVSGTALAATTTLATTKRIYHIHPHSDIFACQNCRLRDDRWFMEKHDCRGSRK